MSQSHEAELRRMARERIDQGRLKCDPPGHTWGGYGSGVHCSLCGVEILPAEIEYEVELAKEGNEPSYYFHLQCYVAWLNECKHISNAAHR